MAKDKIKVKVPRPDPRYGDGFAIAGDKTLRREGENVILHKYDPEAGGTNRYPISMGEPMDVRDHPAHNKPTATEHHDGTVLGDTFSALGPDASDAVMTSQMDKSNEISQSVPRRGLND
jgi:hypothetical protein